MDAIIVNLDALIDMYNDYLKNIQTKKYNGFSSLRSILYVLGDEASVILMSNLRERAREEILQWIHDKHIPCDLLYMRPENDEGTFRSLQEQWYNEEIKPGYAVWVVFEDYKLANSIAGWHELQLPVQLINHQSY